MRCFFTNEEQATGWAGSDGSRHPLSSAIMVLQNRYTAALLEDSIG